MTTPPGTLPVDDSAVHTVREIAQQPALWREVDRIVGASREALDAFLDPLVARGDLRVVLTGAGTSAFAGQVLQPSLARHLGRRVDAVPTTDLVADPAGASPRTCPRCWSPSHGRVTARSPSPPPPWPTRSSPRCTTS